MSFEHRHEDNSSCKKFSGVSPNLNSKCWTYWLSCNVLYPGNTPLDFHWLAVNSVQSSVFWWTVETTPNFAPMLCLIEGSRVSHQDTIQKLKRRRHLCAEDWWLFLHQSKTNISMNDSFNQLFPILRSHLARTPISTICRTFVSLWGPFYSWWNATCLSNSFPWIPLIPMSQTWTLPISTKNVFSPFSVTFEILFVFFALDHLP